MVGSLGRGAEGGDWDMGKFLVDKLFFFGIRCSLPQPTNEFDYEWYRFRKCEFTSHHDLSSFLRNSIIFFTSPLSFSCFQHPFNPFLKIAAHASRIRSSHRHINRIMKLAAQLLFPVGITAINTRVKYVEKAIVGRARRRVRLVR